MLPLDVQFSIEEMTPAQLLRFDAMIEAGETPRLAACLALQKAPAGKCDSSFMSGFAPNGGQFAEDWVGDAMLAKARQYDPNFSAVGKVYLSGLCPEGKQGHPDAWVSQHDATGHIKRVCEKYGKSSEGMVNYTPTMKDEYYKETPYRVSDKVVAKHVLDAVAADPSLREKKDLVESVREKLTPKDLK